MSRNNSTASASMIAQFVIVLVLHLMLLVIPLYFRFVTEELFEFNKILLLYAGTIILVGAWVFRMIIEKRILWRHTWFHVPVAIFLLSQLLATIFSIDIHTSLFGYYGRFHGGLLSLLCYALVYGVITSTVHRKHIAGFLQTALLAGSLVSLYGIFEHYGYSVSCLLLSNGKTFDTACWIQDVQNRVFASFGQPNWLAAYVITVLPYGLYMLLRPTTTKSQQIWYGTAVALMTIVLLFTQSRSGFLGLVAATSIFGGIGLWQLAQSRGKLSSTTVRGIASIAALIIAPIVWFGSPFTPSLLTNNQTVVSQQVATAPVPDRLSVGGTDSGEIRKIVWQGALAVWKRYPVFGSGVETFAYSYYLDRPVTHNIVSEWDFLYNKAHNEFLNFFATTGTVGGVAYGVLLGALVAQVSIALWQNRKKIPFGDDQLLLTSVLASVVAQTVSNFFGFSTVMITLLLFVSFAIVQIILKPDAPTHPVSSDYKTTTLQNISLTVTVIICVYFLLAVYRYWLADVAYARAHGLSTAGDLANSFEQIQVALALRPSEALYYDELAATLADIAVQLGETNDATVAAEVATSAITASNVTLELNPQHLNFYKSRSRIMITLSQLDPSLLHEAATALAAGIERAPTDAKLYYNRALIEETLNNHQLAVTLMQQAVELKPNYIDARFELGKLYETDGNDAAAREQYEFILQRLTPDNQPVQDRLDALMERLPGDE